MATPDQPSGKSCYWSITINNPTDDDLIRWEGLKGEKWIKKVMGQLEKGENGTPHLQGMLNTESVRFAQIKRALPRAHIEIARKPAALERYVQKEDTRMAQLQTTRVATQADVQRGVLTLALAEYRQQIFPKEFTKNEFYDWMTVRHVRDRHWAEILTDAAIKELIREGYYGIEFVMCNPQVRLAFKKYFCEIVIREYARQDEVQGTQVAAEAAATPRSLE